MKDRDYNQFEKKRPEVCKNKRENCKGCQAHCHCTLQEAVIKKQIGDEKGTTGKTYNIGYTC